jgi:hypothetical protein
VTVVESVCVIAFGAIVALIVGLIADLRGKQVP